MPSKTNSKGDPNSPPITINNSNLSAPIEIVQISSNTVSSSSAVNPPPACDSTTAQPPVWIDLNGHIVDPPSQPNSTQTNIEQIVQAEADSTVQTDQTMYNVPPPNLNKE